MVILTSDHGDHSGAHKLEHKSTCYEAAARIPFLVMRRGHEAAGLVDRTHLVSSGLDLLPTVCDYAGLPKAKADPRGRSLRPLIEGREVDGWRKTLGVEAQVFTNDPRHRGRLDELRSEFDDHWFPSQ